MNTVITILLIASITLSVVAIVADGLDARRYRRAMHRPVHCSRCRAYSQELHSTRAAS